MLVQRREFLETTGKTLLGSSAGLVFSQSAHSRESSSVEKCPNIVLILTDDQGYGDIGCHGNDKIHTPNLDRFATESVEFTQFCVSPVCAPTRASLMTGRYNYRTGVVDTWMGRAIMCDDEVTLAEMFGSAGYRTGIFGKWHLGDNYPFRSIDQGFQESLVHKGGGICQPSDPPGGDTYFDPILQHNGKPKKYKGYCTDIFTSAAIDFIKKNQKRPFFVYLATNAPHTPLQIDHRYVQPYLDMGLDEVTAKVYGMITNLDENIGRLNQEIKELGLDKDTIVIVFGDNGPQQERYTAGLRGLKTSVYEGGIRVPFFIRWLGKFKAGKKVDRLAAHIDIAPTLLDLCGVQKPASVTMDGISLAPLLKGGKVAWPDRTLYFQWHRGDVPELFRNCAARSQRYKLVNGEELYDLENDPGEQKNIAKQHRKIVTQMRKGYEDWFLDVSSTHGYAPPRIQLGTPYENPTILTRQDWRGPHAGWRKDSLGYWEVEITTSGKYNIRCDFEPRDDPGTVGLKIGDMERSRSVKRGTTSCVFEDVPLKPHKTRLETWLALPNKKVGATYVEVQKT